MAQTNNPFLQSPFDSIAQDDPQEGLLPGQQSTLKTAPIPEVKAEPAPAADAPEPKAESRRPPKVAGYLPPSDLLPIFEQAAQQYDVPVNVLMALGHQESRYNPAAIGQPTEWGRAKGMMQYLDDTAKGLGINPFDPTQAIPAAAKQLRERLDRGETMIDAVREHFAGPDRKKWGAKTAAYGDEVMAKAFKIGGDFSNAPASSTASATGTDTDIPADWVRLTPEQAAEIEAKQASALPTADPKKQEGSGFTGLATDIGNNLKLGVDMAARDVRELVGRIPGVGKPIVEGIDAADAYLHGGKKTEQVMDEFSAESMKNMTPEMRAALEKKWWDSDKGTLGSAWTDPRSYLGGVVQSLPEQVLTMGPSMALAKGAFAMKMASGASQAAASQIAARTAMAAGALSEGALGGAQAAREVRQTVTELKPEILAQSDAYKALLAQGMTPDQAKTALANDLSTRAFVTSGLVTGAFGGMGDRAIAKLFTEQVGGNVVKRALAGFGKAALAEGLFEELPQSAGQQIAQNEAVKQANPNQSLTEGVANQALGGVAIGMAQGGAMGGVAGASNRGTAQPEQPQEQPQADQPRVEPTMEQPPAAQPAAQPAPEAQPAPQAEAPAAPAPAPAAPSGPLSAATKTVAQGEQPRVTVSAPEGTISGTMLDYQEDEQGNFTAQVQDDEGNVFTLGSADGVTIAPADQPAGPLTAAVKGVAAEVAANPDAVAAPMMEQPQPAQPAQSAAPDYTGMDLPTLRATMKQIAQAERAPGADVKALRQSRREVERQIKNRTAEAQEGSRPSVEPLVAGPFDKREAANKMMLRFAEQTGQPHEVVEANGKFTIQAIKEQSDAGAGVDTAGRVPTVGDDAVAGAAAAATQPGDQQAGGARTAPPAPQQPANPIAPDAGARPAVPGHDSAADAQPALNPQPAAAAQAPAPTPERAATRAGAPTAVRVNERKVPAQWEVVEADELEATIAKADNQYRDRTRAASQAQIGQIANAPDFDLLADSPVMDYGAPTLARDGRTIIGGNGRFAGLVQAYRQGTAAEYRAELEANAARLGVNVEGMKNPVLVRRFAEDVDVKEAAIASNEGGGLKMSALEQAKVDAERMGDMADFVVGDNGEIASAANARFIRGFMTKMPQNQQASFVDADGKLSQEGIVRIRNAVLYRAYGDSPTLARMVESADPGLRNIVTALLRVAPKIADVKARIADGDLHDLDISDELIGAVEQLNKLRADGTTVDDYINQLGLFGDTVSEEVAAILRYMDANTRSAKAIADFLAGYYDAVLAVGNPKQESMFGANAVPSKQEIIDAKAKRQDAAEPEQAGLLADRQAGYDPQGQPEGTGRAAGADPAESVGERNRGYQNDLFADQLDLFANVDVRPGTVEAQKQAGRAAVSDLARRLGLDRIDRNNPAQGSATSVLGARLLANFVAGQPNQLVGQKVETPADLAVLAQVYRDPRFETFRVFYMRDNKIVGEAGYTSRLPAAVHMPADMLDQIGADKKRFDANSFYLLHNHPSGRATPSTADERLTTFIDKQVPGFRGHVVVDHNEYAVIQNWGSEVHQAPHLNGTDFTAIPEVEHGLLGITLTNPDLVARAAKALQVKDGFATLMLTNAGGKVNLLIDLPMGALDGAKGQKGRTKAKAVIRRMARESGSGGHRFMVLPNDSDPKALSPYLHLIADGILTDIVMPNGTSAQGMGAYFGGDFMGRGARRSIKVAEAGHERYSITPEQAASIDMETRLPDDPIFSEAVANTPGASVGKEGLRMSLVRYQREEQDGAQSIRTGVFYLPVGSANAKHYKTGKTGYGGTQKHEGETVLRAPLFVKGATGGKAPEAAYDAINGKKAYEKMRSDVLRVAVGWGKPEWQKVEGVAQVLEQYGADPMLADEIVANSREGNTLPYAVQENIVAHAVRAAGYDSVVGYSKGKAGHFISEVFDVREATYPAEGVESDLHPDFLSSRYSTDDAAAIRQVMADQSGEATITRDGIGAIAVPYGDEKEGLAHIAARRGEAFMERLPDLLATGEVYTKDGQPDRIFIGNGRDEAVIRTDRDGAKENWLLTAYEKHPEGKQSRTEEAQPFVRLSEKELKDALTVGPVGSVIARLIEHGTIVIHRSAKTLPKAVKVKQGVQAVTMPDGTMHLVAGALTKANGRAVLLHEMFHGGVAPMLGTKEWGNLMGRMGSLYRQAEQSSGKAREFYDRARDRVATAKAKGAVPTRMEVEEFAAYAIEEYERAPDSLPAAIRKWVEDLIGFIKAYMVRRHGKQIGQITPAQLAGFAKMAVMDMAVERRGEMFGPVGELFSIEEDARQSWLRGFNSVFSSKAAVFESGENRLRSNAKRIADLLVSPAFTTHGLGGLETPAQREVLAGVIRLADDTQVRRSIVQFIPVEVMDILAGKQLSTDDLLSNRAVLKDFLSVDSDGSVSVAVDVARALRRAITFVAAKYGSASPRVTRADLENTAAAGAGVSNHSHTASIDEIKGTGNAGTYDADNPDIRYSVSAAPGTQGATGNNPAPSQPGLTPPEQGLLRRVQAQVQDNMNRVKQVQERIMELTGRTELGKSDYYGAETNRPGRIAARLEDARDQMFAPLMEKLAKAGKTQEQLEELLHAMHAHERNEAVAKINPDMPDGGSGMTDAQANAILARYQNDRELHAFADEARGIARATLDLKHAYGMLSDEKHKELTDRYEHYVPLKGDGEYGPKIKRAMGHEERDEHILDNIARDYDQAVVVGEKNLARQSLLRMVLQFADPDLWTVGVPPKGRYVAGRVYDVMKGSQKVATFDSQAEVRGFLEAQGAQAVNFHVVDSAGERVAEFTKPLQDNEVMVYVKGDPVRIQIKDETLARQLRPLDQARMHPILEFMRGTNRFLSKIYTGYNPAFILRNAARDAMTGTINMLGNNGAAVAAKAWMKYPQAVATIGKWAATKSVPNTKFGRYLTEYRMHGGKVGASYMSDLEEQGKKLNTMYEDSYGAINFMRGDQKLRGAKVAGRKIVGGMAHAVEIANQATENALRLSLYIALREEGAPAGKAAQAAKGVTVDFDRKGTSTAALGAIYLFFNPAVQGTANAFKTLAKGEHKAQAWAALGALAALGVYAASAGMGDDKDRWLGEEWENRTKNLILDIGGHRLRVPLSQEFAPLYAFGVALAEGWHGESKIKASARVVSSFLDAYFPLGNLYKPDSDNHMADLAQTATPTMVKPLTEGALNRSSFGSQIVPENEFTKDRPDNLKMYRGTKNTAYDKAAQGIASIGELMGAGKYENDISKVSPETLKSLWRTYTGGLGQFVTDSIGLAGMLVTGPGQVESGDVPIVKDFVRAEDVKPIRGRYFGLARDAEKAMVEFEQAKKAGDGEAIDKLMADPDKARFIGLGKLLRATTKAAAAIGDEKVSINADPDLSSAEKRAKLKELEQEEERLYRSGIEAFR